MTLALAVICQDGLLMAADSQATEQTTGDLIRDIRFPTPKIFPLGQSVLWAGSGDSGLIQRIKYRLDHLDASELVKPISTLRTTFRRTIVETIKELMQMSIVLQNQPNPFDSEYLFCGQSNNDGWILEVLWNGKDTEYKERGFHAIGSGKIFAQVMFSMLLHHKVRNCELGQAKVLAYRVVDSAIEVAAAGIGVPVQMWFIKQGCAQCMDSSELAQIRDTVGLWKQTEVETLQGLFGLPE